MTQFSTKKKVLIVDSSEAVRATAKTLLIELGYEAKTVSDGFQAFSCVIDFQPDIVFLDTLLPQLSGYQVCSVIKNNPEYAKLSIIMMSGKEDIFDQARARISGATCFMSKPFTKASLEKIIKHYAT